MTTISVSSGICCQRSLAVGESGGYEKAQSVPRAGTKGLPKTRKVVGGPSDEGKEIVAEE